MYAQDPALLMPGAELAALQEQTLMQEAPDGSLPGEPGDAPSVGRDAPPGAESGARAGGEGKPRSSAISRGARRRCMQKRK
ncbi:MAG: hypothetical protein ACI4L8_07845 [Candidatus Fimadaptatus sp.]